MHLLSIKKNIPKLPKCAGSLSSKLVADDISAKEVTESVQEEPALAVAILKTVNSAYYGLQENSTVVFWLARDERSSRHDRLLLGEHMGKNIFSPLSELESLVGIQDQRLDERLGLLATRFPDGFVGYAALWQ